MNEWDDDDNLDFIFQQQLEEQHRKEELGLRDGVDWNMFDSIFGVPHTLSKQSSTKIRGNKND